VEVAVVQLHPILVEQVDFLEQEVEEDLLLLKLEAQVLAA